MSFTDEIASWWIVKVDPSAGCKTTAAFFEWVSQTRPGPSDEAVIEGSRQLVDV